MAETLAELLSENQIRLKRMVPGRQEQIICPKCEGGRTRELSLSVHVDDDGEGATWNCKRGSCGWSGGGKLRRGRAAYVPPERIVAKPRPHTKEQESHRPQWLWEFFDGRNIGAKTVETFGVYAMKRWFPDPVGESDAIVFPYRHKGAVVNRKYRPYPAKNPMMQEKDALPTLFGADLIRPGAETVSWVEGEIDVMALHECGLGPAVTLKDGASVGDRGGKRFDALTTHADVLAAVKRFYLAGDNDAPGLALREELALRLGRHRCWLVDWPEGCKDASDTLREHGPDGVNAAFLEAKPYPIEGFKMLRAGSLLALRNKPPPPVLKTGVGALDDIMAIPADGRLIVVTGYPSAGKTTFVRFLMIQTAKKHDRRWLVFSPEMQPWETFVAECAECLVGRPFWPSKNLEQMSDSDIERAEEWLSDRVIMVESDSEDNPPTLDWLLERASHAALAYGITDVLLDPFNEIEGSRGSVTETEFIGRALQRCKAASKRHGFNIWIIAHPAKPQGVKPGEKLAAPGPYSINGSAHWANKTDFGLTVHQPDGIEGASDIHLWKSRFRRWGIKNKIAHLQFHADVGRYSSTRDEPQGF